MLKKNSKKVLDIIAGQKQQNAAKAYQLIHPNSSITTSASNVSQLLAKPEAQTYLQEHVTTAAETVVDVMNNARKIKTSATFQRLAKDSAESILNRELGTPVQTVRQSTTGVTLNIDLTSALNLEPTPQP